MPTRIALITLLLHGGLAAQPFGTDLLVSHGNGDLVRLPPGGTPRRIGRFANGLLNMITMDTDNRSVIGIDTTGPRVLRIDPVQGTLLATVWSGRPLSANVAWVETDQDGDYLVAEAILLPPTSSNLFKVKRDGSAVLTLYSAPNTIFNCFTEDRASGDWLIGDFQAKAIIHLDRRTRRPVAAVALGGTTLQGMVQDPHRTDVYVSTTAMIRYDPALRAVTTLARGVSTNCLEVDRSPDGTGALIYGGTTGGMIIKLDRKGANLGPAGSSGSTPMGIIFDRSRNLAPELVSPPAGRIIRLSFPGQAGKAYVLALSLSGYTPGVTLLDARVIPLTPDNLTIATTQFPLPPLLTGNIGFLDGRGRAVATLDLSTIPLPGLRVWAAAVTLDPAAPLGIGRISRPLLIVR